MKNFFKSLVVGALLLGSVGCSDMFKEDLYEINQEIDKINARIDSLCNAVNTNIASLQTIIDVMQDNDYVDSIVPIVEGGETVGYEITFTQSGSVKIYHGKKGDKGHTPIVGVKQAEDGRWYWTIDGEWLLDGEGDKVLAEAIDGIDGEKGEEGITPKLEVRDNYWYISYDNGSTWVQLGKATGENGKDGDSMFKSITYNEDYVELVLADGKTVIKIPTWASHMLLVDEIAKINNNISALQAAVEALESNDYVQKVTPVKDEQGNVIGYTLQFAFTGDVTIYHGEDGKDGEDGEDGKDGVDGEDGKDGYTPVIGARQHPDGIWYWTIDGEWLLDTNGNRVKTTGEDGADGTVGVTPELKIEDDYWYVSYDKGQSWTKLGKAKGEDGAAGSAGTAGDAFFKGVKVTEDYVTFTLADGTEIKIPTWKVYQELADAVAHLNTNVQSLVDIIDAIKNNDFVTGTEEIIDPQTNEVIGYKLHFSKSGDIEIYHGTTPNAPEIGIKKHPQYGLCWTYNGEYIKDPGTGAPVALPKDGASGVTPMFKIVDGMWFVSMDEGRTWQEAGQATGDQGETGATGGAGDSFFKSVTEEYVKDANGKDVVAYIVMTLADGSEYKIPTAYITDELTKRIAAIEGKFAAINTIVNALQNAEYIKEIVELYDESTPPLLVGYEITFVKYTIGTDGKLAETTRKRTIRTGDAGAAGTVVAAKYDEATDTWYWTLDGEPLKDKDGNYVAINGKNGQAGVTPKMQINKDTNEWEVSYDNGTTWTSTGVKATGPQGPQGNPGQGGAAGDSLFAGVYKDGDYWVFELEKGEKIMVPTAEAFASLAGRVAALEKSAESILSLVNGKKYIESCEPFSNDSGSGYHLVLVSLNAETGEATKEDCFIYNGIAGNTPVVGLRQDEATGDWYWTVDGDDLLVEGKPVKANGPEPSFHIDQNGHLWVNVNGNETDLGNVIGAGGGSGADASILVEEVKDDAGNPTGELIITFMSGTTATGTISVPSWDAFVELQNTVNDIKSNVLALNNFVNGNSYITDYEPIKENGKDVGFKAKQVEYTLVKGEDGNYTTSVSKTTPIEFKYACMVTVVNKGTETAPSWEWVVNGQETGIPMDGSDWVPSVVLHTDNNIYISKANGHDASTLEADLKKEDWQSFWIRIDTSKTKDTFATVTGNENDGYTIEFPTGDKIKVPSYEQFQDVLDRLDDVESTVAGLQPLLDGQTFITGITVKADGSGFDYTYKTVDSEGKVSDNQSGSVSLTGLVIPNGTEGFKVVTGYTDEGEPDYTEMSWDHTPVFATHGGKVYMSIDPTANVGEIASQLKESKGGWIEVYSIPEDGNTNYYGKSEPITATVDDTEVTVGYNIYFPDGNGGYLDPIEVVSKAGYDLLVERVEALEGTVAGLQALLSDLDFTYVTGITEKKDASGNVIGIDFTTKTVTDGKVADGPSGSVSLTGLVIPNGTKGFKVVTGYTDKGAPIYTEMSWDHTPVFATHGGKVYMSIDPTANVGEIASQLKESKGGWIEVYSIPEDANTNYYGKSEPITETIDGVEVIVGYDIIFPDGNGEYLEAIKVVSMAGYKLLVGRVEALESTVAGLQSLLNSKTFITGIKPVEEGGVVVGFEYTSVTINEKGELVTNDPSKVSLTGIVVPNDNGGYNVFTGYDKDGKPVYVELSTNQTPVFGMCNGTVYMSVDKGADATKIEAQITNIKDGINWIEVFKVADVVGTYTEIVENGVVVGYKISFPNPGDPEKPIEYEVGKFITTPKISFNTTGIINYDTATKDEENYVNVEFTITGSFIDTPVVLASCEGNWISTEVDLDEWSEGQRTITGSVGVKPTTAYVGDRTDGKLTIYVPYYGNTAIAQKAMTASGAKEYDGQPTSVGAEQTSFSIEIKAHQSLNTENAPFKLSFEPIKEGDTCDWIAATASGSISGQLDGDEMTYTQNLSVQRNFTGESRSCYMHVYSPDGRKIRKVKIVQDTFDFSTVTNLADEGQTGTDDPANCYIISSPGRYMIPLYEGSTGAWEKTSAKLYKNANNQPYVWTDNTANAIEFTELDTAKDFLLFNVDVEKINDGNTVIAATDENGNIIWSWHLWFCSEEPGLDTYPNSNRTGASDYQLMDRSLGAKSSVITPIGSYKIPWTVYTGLYYQWGRKDPLHKDSPKKDYETYMETIENPKYFYKKWEGQKDGKNLWSGTEKTTNDPCPPGYKVPTNDVWTQDNPDATKVILSLELGSNSEHYAYNISQTSPPHNISFGYGYLDSGGNEIKVIEEEQSERITGKKATGQTSDRKTKYTSSDYTVYYYLYQGAMWASNGPIALNYEFKERPDTQHIIIHNGTMSKQEGGFLGIGGTWKDSPISSDTALSGNTVTDAFYEQLTHPYAKDYKDHSPACALQIRCVKE